MLEINKPHLIQSNVAYGEDNTITEQVISDIITISTEYWTKEPTRKWIDAGVVTAKKGFKWITKWELGKNYISTKILDTNDNLVGTYWDITSEVTKENGHYQAYDWYLDVFRTAGNHAVVLDEDELVEALEAGFLTKNEVEIAHKNAQDIFQNMKSE